MGTGGVTKGKQWVKIGPYLELMDTPGLLWPKLNPELAKHLAYIGSINDDIMDIEQLAGDRSPAQRALPERAARYCAIRLGRRRRNCSSHA